MVGKCLREMSFSFERWGGGHEKAGVSQNFFHKNMGGHTNNQEIIG